MILYGARQVGKTYAVLAFAKEQYDNFIHINFDKDAEALTLFDKDLDISRIIRQLEVFAGKRIVPGKTLLFFDEIQDAPQVLSSLKYFAEDAPEHHVVAAGSLLGVAINHERYSFPVGKVNSLRLYPFTFEEFCVAQDNALLVEAIKESCRSHEKLSPPLHAKALELFRTYLITGGMPASIKSYNESKSFIGVERVLTEIVSNYLLDMSKYANKSDSVKIRATFNSIPKQLSKENRKFQYSVAQPGGTARKFGTAINWLEFAGLALKSTQIDTPQIPLKAYENASNFKLYMHDIGIASHLSETPRSLILRFEEADNTFLGGLAENYAATALTYANLPLRYWTSGATAEIDFVLQLGEDIIPVEVKKGFRVASKSLAIYDEKYAPKKRLRLSAKNFGENGNLLAVPLYAFGMWLDVVREGRVE
jgi:predicted AAA+ superfamily ATPase